MWGHKMKVITAKETRKILRKQYPKLRHIWIFSRKVVLCSDDNIDLLLKKIEAYKCKFKKKVFECEAFALVANAEVKKIIAKLDVPYPLTFGEAAMVYPKRGIHNMNIFITEKYEIRLFEPQTNIITRPNGETVFYVRF